ncbi:MAG: hypothetical protein NWF14_08245 [Candidatus Bathyarchaeota archaeon]|nr:hypothetical protein [Candidatus Bathyarchaeota archaeon]
MGRKKAVRKATRKVDSKSAANILRVVSVPESFLFFTGVGQYANESAPCLTEFCEKLKTVPVDSVEFHFKRGDFGKWISGTLGDGYLTNRLGRLDASILGEDLRTALQRLIQRRVDQLKAVIMTET